MGRRRNDAAPRPSGMREKRQIVRRRVPRSGPRMDLSMRPLLKHVLWIQERAVREMTTPTEIFGDLVEEKQAREAGIAGRAGMAAAESAGDAA